MSTTRPARLRIGITIGIHDEAETLWNNGIKQNAVFLAEALKHCPNVASVTLVNTTPTRITDALPWDRSRWPTAGIDDSKDELDVLIELGGQVDEGMTRYLHERGAKLVSYCCGFEYVHTMESILFDRPSFGYNLFVNREYDAIWMIPQVANISGGYFMTLRRKPATVVPFIWDPVFLEQRTAALPDGGRYTPRSGPRRISVMEPNLDVVKFCFYPAVIADLAYRKRPESIAILQVTNSMRMATKSDEFVAFMNYLDLVRDGKAVFLGTHETPAFLAQNTDIVVSHQWENPLNYMYLEICWQGYPLVHNAHLVPELGYFYERHDVDRGCERLLEVIDTHDAVSDAYRERQRAHIARFLPSNPELVRTYAALLDEVAGGRP